MYKKCPNCKTANLSTNKFCTECGTNLKEVVINRSCFVIADNKGNHYIEASPRYDILERLCQEHNLLEYPRWEIFQCFDEDIDGGYMFTPIKSFIVNDLGEPLLIRESKCPVQFKPST